MMASRPEGAPVARNESPGNIAMGAIALTAAVAAAGVWVPVVLTDPPGWDGSVNPAQIIVALALGRIEWTGACTLIAAAEALLVAGVAVLAVRTRTGAKRRARRADRAARHLARGRDLTGHTRTDVARTAARLLPGQDLSAPGATGAYVGTAVLDGTEVWQSWEDCSVDVWGPRSGKTTTRTIPLVARAPGPVLAASRRPDLYDATRGIRERLGTTWLFDPTFMTGDAQGFWWNPLKDITSMRAARRLASAFTYTGAEVKKDAFFDTKGDNLVACLLLAAGLAGRTMKDVYDWSTKPRETEPMDILVQHGKSAERTVASVLAAAEKTRSGLYGAAEKSLLVLADDEILAWVTPHPFLPEFDAKAFVTSRDTLYLVCEKGAGSPTALIAALTDTVYRYGEAAALRNRTRRLDVPLFSVLDEASQITILENLPNYMAFFGGLNMPLAIFLQNTANAEDAWGKLGWRAMWSNANLRALGGGVGDIDFLEGQSRLVGDWDEPVKTTSTSETDNPLGRRSQSQTTRAKRILDVAELASLPQGRAVVWTSGNPPTMIRTRPWWESDIADAVRDSIDRYAPQGDTDQ
jgi:type IV secretory pathway TraG/TraD family ATPase VirD4